MDAKVAAKKFPAGLVDWAGYRGGGVRRLFHEASGRPAGSVIKTGLLERLETWAQSVGASHGNTPRIVLLVGGPGNGKTEAVEYAICQLDSACGAAGQLVGAVRDIFNSTGTRPPPRIARVDRNVLPSGSLKLDIALVQDASAADASNASRTPAGLLVDELESMLESNDRGIYLACVNRGILDDALIRATEIGRPIARNVLTAIVRSIGSGPDAISCWPLDGFPAVGVWPMDVESLIGSSKGSSPAKQMLGIATAADSWPPPGTCPAGPDCPFCYSRARLSSDAGSTSFLDILRWHELASGKRWSFRDLASLISYLLAGSPAQWGIKSGGDPCAWAAQLKTIAAKSSGKQDALRASAPFLLVAAQYQHALFGAWPRAGARQLRRDLTELGLGDDPTLLGLYHFLANPASLSVPSTLEPQLSGLATNLDPGMADPDAIVSISDSTSMTFRDLDARFSQSVGEALRFIFKGSRRNWFSPLEVGLLEQLARADERLSDSDLVRRRPATAANVRAIVRSFACRLVRRSLGVRAAAVKDRAILAEFEQVVAGERALLHASVKQVQSLLNEQEKFIVSLNTTFGEALPPPERRAILTTPPQKVKALDHSGEGRPRAALQFLGVGSGSRVQAIPLTYDLFKAAYELRDGMVPASLPRPVVALLDTTRARLAGYLVRDESTLEDAEIRIGLRGDTIVREQGEFLVRQGASK